jgi:thymidylate synthase
VPIFDPALDSKRTMGQPCLAHLSFKLREDKGVMVTALYRNHYYVQRTLGNLIGLSQLLYFVARESGLTPKSLVCHSTFARLDTDKGWSLTAVRELLKEVNDLACEQAVEEVA